MHGLVLFLCIVQQLFVQRVNILNLPASELTYPAPFCYPLTQRSSLKHSIVPLPAGEYFSESVRFHYSTVISKDICSQLFFKSTLFNIRHTILPS